MGDPTLDDDYPLTDEHVRAFQRDGHIFLPGVCRSVAEWSGRIQEAALRLSSETRPLPERDTRGRAFIQVMNLWERDEAVRPFVLARRFGGIAARLMGTEGARLYHDQALFKEAGGTITPFHQDQGFWPFDIPFTVTMWMPLVDITPDMGPVQFVTGSHRDGLLGEIGISDESERHWDEWVRERGLSVHSYETMSAGDATFHAGWLLHRATPNTSDRMRAVMTVIYHPADARVMDPLVHGQTDLAKFLPGCGPGDVAASPLNPVVYP